MNITKLFIASMFFALVQFNIVGVNYAFAQNINVSSGIDAKELELINRQPIAPVTKANQNVLGTVKRPVSFEYQEEQGTRITEYTSNGRPPEILVDSKAGTHYEMSKPLDQTPTIPNSTLNRVPSLQLPF